MKLNKMKMQAKVFIYEATYTALQNVYTFFEFFFNLWVYLNRRFVDFCHACISKECAFKTFRNIDKTPMHLTVLLCNEEPSYKDLANLVIWSLASGIPFITFYDHRGVLKKTETKFREAVNKRKRADDHILWHDGETSCKNGIIGNKIHVRTLSVSDGRDSVADVAKQCSKGETVDQQAVDCCLKYNFGFPDPDLGLYFSDTFNVYGYPPWQIRTTEFINLGTHYNITPQRFINALYRYTKTEQRLGK